MFCYFQRKQVFGNWFLVFHFQFGIFPRDFLWSKHFVFHTWAYLLSYSIRILFCEKERLFEVVETSKVVNPPYIVVSLFGRGWSEWYWFAPSLVEVEVCFAPSSERWRLVVTLFGRGVGCCLATGLPLGCEVVVLREEFGTPLLYKSSSVEVPSVGV